MADSRAKAITERLGGHWHGHYGMARCPAHNDGRPSLSIKDGDVRVLYHCFAGCDSATIADLVERGDDRDRREYETMPTARTGRDTGALALSVWNRLRPTLYGASRAYLASRAIEHTSPVLRHDPSAIYKDDADQQRTANALTVLFSDNDGPRAIQRLFLTTRGRKLAIIDNKRFLGPRAGATARLTPPARILGLAEGVEDAMSVTGLFDEPCWAAGGIENYRNLDFPDEVRRIVLFTQHGIEAARAIERGRPNLTANGRTLDVVFPKPNMDWNDMKIERAMA